jgi:hypothetical protein
VYASRSASAVSMPAKIYILSVANGHLSTCLVMQFAGFQAYATSEGNKDAREAAAAGKPRDCDPNQGS